MKIPQKPSRLQRLLGGAKIEVMAGILGLFFMGAGCWQVGKMVKEHFAPGNKPNAAAPTSSAVTSKPTITRTNTPVTTTFKPTTNLLGQTQNTNHTVLSADEQADILTTPPTAYYASGVTIDIPEGAVGAGFIINFESKFIEPVYELKDGSYAWQDFFGGEHSHSAGKFPGLHDKPLPQFLQPGHYIGPSTGEPPKHKPDINKPTPAHGIGQ